MADIYTPPPDYSYILNVPFYMPSNIGDRWAISFDNNGATLIAAALSVVVTISFLNLWNLVSFIGVLSGNLTGKPTRRRYAALVTLWNSNDSYFAFKELLHYTYRCLTHKASPERRADVVYGLIFCAIAFATFGGSIALGIIVPSLLQIGNVAPVKPSALFYPAAPTSHLTFYQDFGIRAPSVLRSLGSVEAAKVTLRKKVRLAPETVLGDGEDAEAGIMLNYNYSLSGVDMGLQGGSDLTLGVRGFCITEYGWTDEPQGQDLNGTDWYSLWDGRDSAWVILDDNKVGPSVVFVYHPDAPQQLAKDSNVSFALVVHSAHGPSITAGSDPWYATEDLDASERPSPEVSFRVKRHRPVLSCWEQDKWSYKGNTVPSVWDLKDIPGIKIPQVLLEVLRTTFAAGPMIVRLGNASGASALKSRTTSNTGIIDGSTAKIFDDMERLILASYVATRNIFVDATMFGEQNYANVIKGPDGEPQDGAGHFVVSSTNIQTFSLTGIVSLLVILAALILLNALALGLVRFQHSRGHKKGRSSGDAEQGGSNISRPDTWTLFRALSAINLFRSVYEQNAHGKTVGWDCKDPVPRDEESVPKDEDYPQNVHVERCSTEHCKGHIRDPATLRKIKEEEKEEEEERKKEEEKKKEEKEKPETTEQLLPQHHQYRRNNTSSGM